MKRAIQASGALSAGLLLAVTGCVVQRDTGGYENADIVPYEAQPASDYGDTVDTGRTPSNLQLSGASLRGNVGDVGVDGDAAWVDGYADGEYASVYTTVDEAMNGAVMTIVDFEGGLSHASLAPGSRTVYNADDLYTRSSGDLFVTVIGCSGPNAGAWEFDQTADVVTIDVIEDPDSDSARLFEYTARFDDGYAEPSVVTGRFRADTP